MAAYLRVLVTLAGLAGCATLPDSLDVKNSQEPGTDRSQELIQLARDIEANGGDETALALYREAVAQSGRAPAAYVQLGDAYLRAKKLAGAIQAYCAALAKDPDDADALLGLGTAYARQGAVAKGLVALTKASPHVNTAAASN